MTSPALLDRRRFLSSGARALAITTLSSPLALAVSHAPRFKAVVFDAFPIFDPRPTARMAQELFGEKGPALMNAWRSRQFEYQWLRALGNRYVDFMRATEDSLTFAARQTGLTLTPEHREKLMATYANLSVWPDVPEALPRLRNAGIRLGFLSNMTPKMLETGIARAKLQDTFEHVLSSDRIQSYKPATQAYQLAVDAFALPAGDILFVAFAGWDVAGAKWFGYPTFWVNRLGSPDEELGVTPDGVGPDLSALTQFLFEG